MGEICQALVIPERAVQGFAADWKLQGHVLDGGIVAAGHNDCKVHQVEAGQPSTHIIQSGEPLSPRHHHVRDDVAQQRGLAGPRWTVHRGNAGAVEVSDDGVDRRLLQQGQRVKPWAGPAAKGEQRRLKQGRQLHAVGQRIPGPDWRTQAEIGRHGAGQSVCVPQHPTEVRQQEAGQDLSLRRALPDHSDRAGRHQPQPWRHAQVLGQFARCRPQVAPGQRPGYSAGSHRRQDAAEALLEVLLVVVPLGQPGCRATRQHVAQPPGEAGDGQGVGNQHTPLIQDRTGRNHVPLGATVGIVLARLVRECGVQLLEGLLGRQRSQDHEIPGSGQSWLALGIELRRATLVRA